MDNCPKCKASWLAEKMTPQQQEESGDATHFRRVIGLDGGRMGIYDGIVAWMCPDCKVTFPRNDSEWAKEMFEEFTKQWNEDDEPRSGEEHTFKEGVEKFDDGSVIIRQVRTLTDEEKADLGVDKYSYKDDEAEVGAASEED